MSESSNSAASLPLPESSPGHPRRMLDRYEIIAEIAKGGMGTVFVARLSGAGGFERLMALKVMHDHLAEDDTFVTMLLDEARTAAHIHHPNAVGITDVVESPVGYYLVMDYVDGFPLSHIVTHPDLSDQDRTRIGTRLIIDAAQGLHAAHTAKNTKGERLGIVHRDVSPQNVLVGTDGTGRIVDFGIALAASRVASSRPGTLKGKPQYMAPEQAKGEPCDARTDVFALGIILWEILTYERLFFGEMDVAVLVQVMECVVPSPRERNPAIPQALADVAMKALQKNPADRFASARDFAAALEKAAASADLLASSAEAEAIIGKHFADEIAAKHEAIAAHLSRSTGAPAPLGRGELALVSKLFEKKRSPKMRDMHTRTGGVAAPQSSSGVRSRGSAEIEVAPTAHATERPDATASTRAAAPGPAKSPPLGLLAAAVIGAIAILSFGAYMLSRALEARDEPVAVAAPSEPALPSEPVVAPAVVPVADPVAELAPPAVVPVATPPEVTPVTTEVTAPAGGTPPPGTTRTGGRRHRTEGETTAPGGTPPGGTPPGGTSTGGTTPAFEANPYLGN